MLESTFSTQFSELMDRLGTRLAVRKSDRPPLAWSYAGVSNADSA